MRSRPGAAARKSLRLARLPRTASSAQRLRRLRSTRAAAPVLLMYAEVAKSLIYFQWVQNLGTPRQVHQYDYAVPIAAAPTANGLKKVNLTGKPTVVMVDIV